MRAVERVPICQIPCVEWSQTRCNHQSDSVLCVYGRSAAPSQKGKHRLFCWQHVCWLPRLCRRRNTSSTDRQRDASYASVMQRVRISFNASKSKCIRFTPCRVKESCQLPVFCIGTDVIEFVVSWPHLGNILHTDQSDSACILNRRNILVSQINDTLCFFGKLNPIVKTNLLYTYCSSLYGSVLWDLRTPEIEFVCTAWRCAIRRIWSVPRNTHCKVVTALSGKLPLFEELCSRVINFHFRCLDSPNALVRFFTKYCISNTGAESPHGGNIRLICTKYNLPYISLFDSVNRCSLLSLLSTVTLESQACDSTGLNVLMELLMIRDNIVCLTPTGCLARSDIDEMVTDLCTSAFIV